MKAIMISIKPKWCAKIMNGEKNIEVRKNKALVNAIQKLINDNGYADIYVYCSKDKDLMFYSGSQYMVAYGTIKEKRNHKYNGKVIFKFRCYKVEEIKYHIKEDKNDYEGYYIDKENYCPTNKIEICINSCLSINELDKYLQGNVGYAIHISNLEIFDRPKELSEFRHWVFYKECSKCPYGKCDNDYGLCSQCCEIKPLTKAPQIFAYIESEE